MPPEAKEAAVTTDASQTQTTEQTTQKTEATATAGADGKTSEAAPAAKESMVSGDDPAASKEGDQKEKEPKEVKPAVPEKYELKLPEGSQADASYLESVAALAKEKKWSNERAQEHVDAQLSAVSDYVKKQQSDLQNLNGKTWKEELMNDPDFGGKHFEENGHIAYKAAVALAGKEFADELKAMNLNHHPRLFKLLVRAGKQMEPDKLVESKHTTSGKQTKEEKLKAAYPSMYKEKDKKE